MVRCRSVILRIKNFLDKSYRENQNTRFIGSNSFKNLAVYKKMWQNIVEAGRTQMTMGRMRIACWVPEGIGT
jgi:hypothetical protein